MRYVVTSLLLFPALAYAQTRQGELNQSSVSSPEAATTALAPSGEIPGDTTPTIARSPTDVRIPSKNEAYNRARQAEGRLGARLGNDQSYRITGN